MSDEIIDEKKVDDEPHKILTFKELLERKKKNLAESKGFQGRSNNFSTPTSATPKGGAHKARGHRPQGG